MLAKYRAGEIHHTGSPHSFNPKYNVHHILFKFCVKQNTMPLPSHFANKIFFFRSEREIDSACVPQPPAPTISHYLPNTYHPFFGFWKTTERPHSTREPIYVADKTNEPIHNGRRRDMAGRVGPGRPTLPAEREKRFSAPKTPFFFVLLGLVSKSSVCPKFKYLKRK